jgi:hypothetical protein
VIIGVTKNQKNQALNSTVQISGTPHMYCNFKISNMGKTWHFITIYSKQTKTNYLATARTQKEKFKINTLLQEQRKHKQNKKYQVASHKALSL